MANANGTIGCTDPSHNVNEPPPRGLTTEDRIRWIVDHAPPLSDDQRTRIASLLAPLTDPLDRAQIGGMKSRRAFWETARRDFLCLEHSTAYMPLTSLNTPKVRI
jgi:hypothetical protein